MVREYLPRDKAALVNMQQMKADYLELQKSADEVLSRKITRKLNALELNIVSLERQRDEWKAWEAEKKANEALHKKAVKKVEAFHLKTGLKNADWDTKRVIKYVAKLIEPTNFGTLAPDEATHNRKVMRKLMCQFKKLSDFKTALNKVTLSKPLKTKDGNSTEYLFPDKIVATVRKLAFFTNKLNKYSYVSTMNYSAEGHPEIYPEVVLTFYDELKKDFKWHHRRLTIKEPFGKKSVVTINSGVVLPFLKKRAYMSHNGLVEKKTSKAKLVDGKPVVKEIKKTGKDNVGTGAEMESFARIDIVDLDTTTTISREIGKVIREQDSFLKSFSWKFSAAYNERVSAYAAKEQFRADIEKKSNTRSGRIAGMDIDVPKLRNIVFAEFKDDWDVNSKFYDRLLTSVNKFSKLKKYTGIADAINEYPANRELVIGFAADVKHAAENWKI